MRRRWIESVLLFLVGAAAVVDGINIVLSQRRLMGAREGGTYVALLGFFLVCVAVVHFLRGVGKGGEPRINWRASGDLYWVLLAFALLAAYVISLGYLGYLLSTAVFLVVYFRVFGSYRWAPVVISSLATAVVSAYVWSQLGMMLPQGILPWP